MVSPYKRSGEFVPGQRYIVVSVERGCEGYYNRGDILTARDEYRLVNPGTPWNNLDGSSAKLVEYRIPEVTDEDLLG